MSLLARGRDVSFICNELYLARNTVKGYTKRIYAKLDIHSKQEAIDIVLSAISRP
ncbi:LuxR C-terminal-related transcriptional regulator [uncultured Slackia sp.]|uniref:helix-turn-helix transcriptional regulator n=1 Tax=uncultured Slackia sp. TaxID=665903 RepID=UPI00280C39CC|nr:LuxR C-terminal-related transcriptional regulator [uncultured Slackia sp.]